MLKFPFFRKCEWDHVNYMKIFVPQAAFDESYAVLTQ